MRNLTQLAPSLDDIVLLPFRIGEQAKAFAYYYGLDDIFGRIRGSGAYLIAENTANRSNISASLTNKAFAKQTLSSGALSLASSLAAASVGASPGASASGAAAVTGGLGTGFEQVIAEGGLSRFIGMISHVWKSMGGVVPYVISKWAIVTILMSFLINRTNFYASPRIPLTLWWPVRLGLYLLPILAVSTQMHWLLQGLKCQTSPDFSMIRYGNASKLFEMDYAGEGGFLHGLASILLLQESDEESCMRVHMANAGDFNPAGSLSLLWPLFLSLCFAAFTDTLASSLQGRVPLSDFNLVELSFAFNEAESVVVKIFESALNASSSTNGEEVPDSWDRKMLLRATNTSPDMLIIALIWAASSVTTMILGVVGKRHSYRLLNTGFWGIAYFFAISRSILQMWNAPPGEAGLFNARIPMILLMGFIPHFIVVTGMLACAFIYGAALILTALSLPPAAGTRTSFREKLMLAYRNLQANVHFSNATPLSFRMTDDFYTALLNTGFTILTAASEAVYLNEASKVRVSNLTWIERKRIQELQQGLLFKKTRQAIPSGLRAAINDRIEMAMGNPQPSGYGLERKIRGQEKEEALAAVQGTSALPVVQRKSRFGMAMRLIAGTFWLILGFNAKVFLMSLELCGITWRPRLADRLIGKSSKTAPTLYAQNRRASRKRMDLVTFPDGAATLGGDNNVDIEQEFKRRGVAVGDMDEQLYGWWRQGGFWGEKDSSGDYAPSRAEQDDDDTTSLLSMSSNITTCDDDNDDWEELHVDSGRRTPTQRNPYPSSREPTPFEYEGAFSADQLATLLDPKDPEEQHEARLLARRLRRNGIMTRSQYQRETLRERTAILASSRYGARLAVGTAGAPLSPQAEEAALESFVLDRRAEAASLHRGDAQWSGVGAEAESAGPQCVVCQDAPRTVLLWPCGCLCLCDECRVNMAARNFNSCICCRTGTVAYSRLFVP